MSIKLTFVKKDVAFFRQVHMLHHEQYIRNKRYKFPVELDLEHIVAFKQ